MSLLLLFPMACWCSGDMDIRYYMGFTLERLFGSTGTDVSYEQNGIDNSDSLVWTAGAPPQGAPYSYIYTGVANYNLSGGVGASFESGWYFQDSIFAGIELIYVNYELSDDNNSLMKLNTNTIAALANVVYMLHIDPDSAIALYFGGGLGFGGCSIKNSTYTLNYLQQSSNPPDTAGIVTPGAYVSTEMYPVGAISKGHSSGLAFKIRGGIITELEKGIFANFGLAYFGLSELRSISGLGNETSNADILLEDESGSGAATMVPVVVSMRSFPLEISPFSYDNFGIEISIRVSFDS